jgi:predicted small secreted protein
MIIFILLTNCNTLSGTVEGTVRGVKRDVQTTTHYTTCIFTKVQCGDLDLKSD